MAGLTLSGGVRLTGALTASAPAAAAVNYSYSFNGSTDYLSIASTADFSSTQNWSVEAWIYPVALTAGNYNQVLGGVGFSFGNYSGTFYITNNSIGILAGTTITVGAWQHVALVNTANTNMKLYQGGVLQGTVGASNFTMGATAIAANYVAGIQPWNGYISNLRIINNSASPIYSADFTPPTTKLTAVAGTTLLTAQDSTFKDNSSNNYTLTQNGSPTTTSSIVPF